MSDRASFEITLREDQWETIAEMLEREITKCKAIQKKTRTHPGFTISSDILLINTKLKSMICRKCMIP